MVKLVWTSAVKMFFSPGALACNLWGRARAKPVQNPCKILQTRDAKPVQNPCKKSFARGIFGKKPRAKPVIILFRGWFFSIHY